MAPSSVDGDVAAVEWQVTRSRPSRTVLTHVDGPLVGLVVIPSPTGDQLAWIDADRDMLVRHDPSTGEQTRVPLPAVDENIVAWTVVPAARRSFLVAGYRGGRVCGWDVATGEEVDLFDAGATPAAMVVSGEPAEPVLIVGGDDGTLTRWDVATGTGRPIHVPGEVPGEQDGPITALCVAPVEGRRMLVAARTGSPTAIEVWDPDTGALRHRFPWGSSGVTGLEPIVLAGRSLVAVADSTGAASVWDPSTGANIRQWRRHGNGTTVAAVVTDAGHEVLVTTQVARSWEGSAGDMEYGAERVGELDGALWLCDPETGRCRTLAVNLPGVEALARLRVAGREVVATIARPGAYSAVELWSVTDGPAQRVDRSDAGGSVDAHLLPVRALCGLSVAGRRVLASAGEDCTVRVFDARTGRLRVVLDGHTAPVRALCAYPSEDGPLLVSGDDDGTLRLWDAASGRCLRVIAQCGHTTGHGITHLALVPGPGRTDIAAVDACGDLSRWDIGVGLRVPLPASDDELYVASLLADGAGGGAWIVDSTNMSLHRWDPETGAVTEPVREEAGWLLGTVHARGRRLGVLSPRRVVPGGPDCTDADFVAARLWDPVAMTIPVTIEGSGARAGCEVMIDGRPAVALGTGDERVSVHDADTGALLRTVRMPEPVNALAGGEPGVLVAASDTGLHAVRLAPAPVGEAVDEAVGEAVPGGETAPPPDASVVAEPWLVEPHRRLTAGVIAAGRLHPVDSIVTRDGDGALTVRDPATGAVHELADDVDEDAVVGVVPGSDGLLVACVDDMSIRRWDATTGEPLDESDCEDGWEDDRDPVAAVAVEGRVVVATEQHEDDREVWLHDPSTGARSLVPAHEWRPADDATLTEGGTRSVLIYRDPAGVRWTWAPAPAQGARSPQPAAVDAACLVPVAGNELIATTGAGRLVQLWEHPTDAGPVRSVQQHVGRVTAMCPIVVDGHRLVATGGDDAWVRLWDPVDGGCRYSTRVTHQICYSISPPVIRRLMAMAWGGTTVLAVEAADDSVCFWDPTSDRWFRPPQRPLGEFDQVVQVAWAPVPVDGRDLVAVAQQEKNTEPAYTLRLADPEGCRYTVPLVGPPASMLTVAYGGSPVLVVHDGHEFSDYEVALESRDALTGTVMHRHPIDADSSVPLCVVPAGDAPLVAVPRPDGPVTLWDPLSGTVRHTVENPVRVAAMTGLARDGRGLLAVAGFDGTLRLWDTDTGRLAARVRLPHPATALVVTTDGGLVAGHRGGLTAITLPDP
jgi:WD40 repeat protein